MDMDQAFDLGPPKRGRRDPHEPLKSGADYLRTVVDERDHHADVVVVEVPESAKPNNLRIADFKKVNHQSPEGIVFPDRAWYNEKVASFSALRQRLAKWRDELKSNDELPHFILPECEDERGWRLLCLRKWTSQIPPEKLDQTMVEKLTKEHKGTPPLLKLVLALPEHTVSALLTYQIGWLLKSYDRRQQESRKKKRGEKRKLSGIDVLGLAGVANTTGSTTATKTESNEIPSSNKDAVSTENPGKSAQNPDPNRSRTSSIASNSSVATADSYGEQTTAYEMPKNYAHWLFALLAVVEKPFDPDTTSAVRDLARFSAERRAEIKAADDPLIYVYSWFIGVVAVYFEQRDLLDEFGVK